MELVHTTQSKGDSKQYERQQSQIVIPVIHFVVQMWS